MRKKSIKVELNRGEKITFEACFKPRKPGDYNVKVPIFVREYNEGLVYNYINLSGEFTKPILYSDACEVGILNHSKNI